MVVPIGDAPNPRGVALVTYLLIALNVAVYALVTVPLGAARPDAHDPLLADYLRTMATALGGRVSQAELLRGVTAYDLLVFRWGFRPAHPSLVDVLTSMFLHGGFLHLAGNMLFLWIYGDNVEHALGRIRYLLAYLGTGAAAVAFHWLWAPSSQIPLVGASGAISGVLGIYFLWFPRNRVRLLWMLPPFVMQVFEIPARLVLGLYLVIDNLLPFAVSTADRGVAHGAHIGGFLAGLAIAWLLDRRAVEGVPRDYREARAHHPVAPPGGEIRAAIAAGRLDEAAEEYFALPAAATRGLLATDEAIALARWLRSAGHAEAALAVARRGLREPGSASDLAELHLLAGQVLLEDLREPAQAFQHLREVLDLAQDGAAASAARRALAAIDRLQKRSVGKLHRPHPW